MSPAIRTIVLFLGLLILVIAASLYFVRTTRTGDGERSAAAPEAQTTTPQPALHPDILAGLEALKEFRTEEARALFGGIPETDPSYVEALKNIAKIQWQEGEYGQAMVSFTKLTELVPNDPTMHINLGWAQYRTGLLPASELSTLRALELDPDSVVARYNVAFFRLATGNVPSAMLAYHRAMRRDGAMKHFGQAREHLLQLQAERPDFAAVHYALAYFANSIGNRQQEVEELELYLAMNPQGPAVEVARARLAEAKAALR